MKIAKTAENKLTCSPFGNLTAEEPSQVIFEDLDLEHANFAGWMHISCSYSFFGKTLEASLYANGTTYKYSKDLGAHQETRYIDPDHYLLILSNDKSNKAGS